MGKIFEIPVGNKTKKYKLTWGARKEQHLNSKRAEAFEKQIRTLICKYSIDYISFVRQEYPIITKKDNHIEDCPTPPSTPIVEQEEPFECSTQAII